MIIIEERKSEKLSGLTSLFVSFDYQESIVNILKQILDIYLYNKKTREWETTILSLSKLVDTLCYEDDIELHLMKYNSDTTSIKLQDIKLKTNPYKHQLDAVNYGINHNKWLLLDDQGLGKSLEILGIAKWLKENKSLKHCLIVCGINTLKANWKKEISIHSDLTYRVIGEKVSRNGTTSYSSIRDRWEELTHPINEFFIIINIESLRDKDIIKAINKRKDIDMIVVDEIHKISNSSSQQANGLLNLSATYKIGLTGTLLVNSPIGAYTSLKWLGIEKATLTNFKKQYCLFGGYGGYEITGYKNLEILKSEIESNSLRRTKQEVLKDLPPKNIIKEYVSLSESHLKFYNKIKNAVREDSLKVNLDKNNILALTTRLRQATVCPNILTTENIVSSKIERCIDLVSQIVSSGDKVVIFSTFKEPVYELEKLLEEYNPLIGTGDLKDADVSDNIDKFQKEDKYKVFIGTTSKCGTGITLTAASYMIFLDTPFTSSSYVQAQDRIYRIGTTKQVFIYNLICENTIDERVAKIVDTKGAISDYMLNDALSNDALKILKDYILDI